MKIALKHSKDLLRLAQLGAVLLLQACAVFQASSPSAVLEAPTQHVQVVAIGFDESPRALLSAEMVRRIASLQLQIEDYPLSLNHAANWRSQLAAVEMLAGQGYADLAKQRLDQLAQQVSRQTQRYFQHHAQIYLQQAGQFAFLNSDQASRLRAAQLAAERGQDAQVYRIAKALVRELWSASNWATVRQGDTLARVAARPEVYDNPRLWPLLKQANRGYFYRSNQARAGWRLRYPVHPRLDEIFAAVEGRLD